MFSNNKELYGNALSIVKDFSLREIFGDRIHSWTAGKKIPSNLIEYFECSSTATYQLANDNVELVPPYACSFSQYDNEEHIAIITKEDGSLLLLDTHKRDRDAIIAQWMAHKNAIFDVKWLPKSRHFLTASADYSIRLHDAVTKKKVVSFLGHKRAVKTISLKPKDYNIFASGSRDGTLRLWDQRVHKIVRDRGCEGISCVHTVTNCHQLEKNIPQYTNKKRSSRSKSEGGMTESVTSVVYQNEHFVVSAGSTDGKIKIWDTRRLRSRGQNNPYLELPYAGTSKKQIGFSDLVVNSCGSQLFAYCLDGTVYQYNLYTNKTTPALVYRGHQATSFYLKQSLSPDDRFLACGSGDSCAYIYTVNQPVQYPVLLRGHQNEVTVPAWCPSDPTQLVTLADDCSLFIWTMHPERQFKLPERGQLVGMAERKRLPTTTLEQQQPYINTHASTTTASLRRGNACRTSLRLRQVNIQDFVSPSRDSAGLVEPVFSAQVVLKSPRKLILSPLKLAATSVADNLDGTASILSPVGKGQPSTPVRKRLRFDFSNDENDESSAVAIKQRPLADLSNISPVKLTGAATVVASSRSRRSSMSEDAQVSRKRPLLTSPAAVSPDSKRMKTEVGESSNVAPSSRNLRLSHRFKQESPARTPNTPKSGRRRAKAQRHQGTPITYFFKPMQ